MLLCARAAQLLPLPPLPPTATAASVASQALKRWRDVKHPAAAPHPGDGFAKLKRAADGTPPEQRPPEMRPLLASERAFRASVDLAQEAMEAERPGLPLERALSQRQWLQARGPQHAESVSEFLSP